MNPDFSRVVDDDHKTHGLRTLYEKKLRFSFSSGAFYVFAYHHTNDYV